MRPQAATSNATGLSPSQILSAYNLPSGGGSGTIAIVDAFDDPAIVNDSNVFSSYFGLPLLNSTNFETHMMASQIANDSVEGYVWPLEMSLDVQWAHAIAPNAKILLVEAINDDTPELLSAVDYAASRADVVAVSMSWGLSEMSNETAYDSHFISAYGASFFAGSGDDGVGVNWPAVSVNVIAVGGTTLTFAANGSVASETAWDGSGGGRSNIEPEPAYQTLYNIPPDSLYGGTGRGVPDVSFDADPASGVSVYDSIPYNDGSGWSSGWWVIGGTSLGAPSWAAIDSIYHTVTNSNLYTDANPTLYTSFFRDITVGNNSVGLAPGPPLKGKQRFNDYVQGYNAGPGYDYVTGLGSPLTANFTTPQVLLTIAVPQAPAGGATILVDGTPYTAYANSPAIISVTAGIQHTVWAEGWTVTKRNTVYYYVFLSWSDGSTADPRSIVLSSNLSLTATYTVTSQQQPN
jgi:subtilase family serine protease